MAFVKIISVENSNPLLKSVNSFIAITNSTHPQHTRRCWQSGVHMKSCFPRDVWPMWWITLWFHYGHFKNTLISILPCCPKPFPNLNLWPICHGTVGLWALPSSPTFLLNTYDYEAMPANYEVLRDISARTVSETASGIENHRRNDGLWTIATKAQELPINVLLGQWQHQYKERTLALPQVVSPLDLAWPATFLPLWVRL